MQKWEKLKVIVNPGKDAEDLAGYASVPFGELIDEKFLKLYFSSRGRENRSFTRYVILDLENDLRTVEWGLDPVLEPGRTGFFDDAGVMACCLLKQDAGDLMFYIGWNLSQSVPFRNSLGVARRPAGQQHFQKLHRGPILDRSPVDPGFIGSCDVVPNADEYLMYYLSCDEWELHESGLRHRYNIKIAQSTNCLDWSRDGSIAIDYKDENEYALSTPRVMTSGNRWRMWFSYRGDRYKIGYAESEDGFSWTRYDHEMDHFTKTPLAVGFDDEMQCYPFLFNFKGNTMMLYNGNGYGRSGIGTAVLQD